MVENGRDRYQQYKAVIIFGAVVSLQKRKAARST